MTKPSKELLKRTYAQDASIYQETPQAVAFPASAEQVIELVIWQAAYPTRRRNFPRGPSRWRWHRTRYR